MKILLADDHTVLRRGLMQILTEAWPAAEFGQAATTEETLVNLRAGRWDILLLDLFMPGGGGLEVLREVRRQRWQLPILVLSSAPEEQMAVRVLRAGASGYLNKQAAPTELLNAVRRLLEGGRYVSPQIAELLAVEIGRVEEAAPTRLTDREMQVLRLLTEGKSIKEAAGELGLSAKTVSTFHTRIWEKLAVRSDAEMVRVALQRGLLDADP